jgi:hypothetical protein
MTNGWNLGMAAASFLGRGYARPPVSVKENFDADGRTSAESGLVASRLAWHHTSRLSSYYEIQVLRDRFKNYSSRVLPAVGVGTTILDRKEVGMVLDAGFGGVFTKLATRPRRLPPRRSRPPKASSGRSRKRPRSTKSWSWPLRSPRRSAIFFAGKRTSSPPWPRAGRSS